MKTWTSLQITAMVLIGAGTTLLKPNWHYSDMNIRDVAGCLALYAAMLAVYISGRLEQKEEKPNKEEEWKRLE